MMSKLACCDGEIAKSNQSTSRMRWNFFWSPEVGNIFDFLVPPPWQRHLPPSWLQSLGCLKVPRWGCSAPSLCRVPVCPPPSPGSWGTTPSTGRKRSSMWRLWPRYKIPFRGSTLFSCLRKGTAHNVHHSLISSNNPLVCKALVVTLHGYTKSPFSASSSSS